MVKKCYLILGLLIAVFSMSYAQQTETIGLTAEEQGFSDKEKPTSVEGEYVTLTFSKGTSNDCQYYATGDAVRIYKGGAMTITSTKTMAKIELTYNLDKSTSSMYAIVTPNTNGNQWDATTKTWTGNSNEVVVTAADVSGHLRMKEVIVTFADETVANIEAPSFSMAGGVVSAGFNVAITAEDENYMIIFTTNGSTPTYDAGLEGAGVGTVYSSPVSITKTTTLKAIAVDVDNVEVSSVASITYTVVVTAPSFSEPAGMVASGTTISLSQTDGFEIIYTTDGTTPTIQKTGTESVYQNPIAITSDITIKAIAVDSYNNYSEVASARYMIIDESRDGSEENPYSVIDIINGTTNTESIWVKGYIVGFMTSSGITTNASMFTGTNYVLSDDPNELSANYTIPVQITDNGDVTKDDWGLDKHPDLIGLQIMYKGTRARYFGLDGAMKMPEDIYGIMYLDEDSEKLFPSVAKANVTIHRPIKADQWAAISLPIDLNEEQIIEIFGEGTKMAEFYGYHYIGNYETGFRYDLSFTTISTLSIESGIPYIIKPTKAVDAIEFEKAIINNENKQANHTGFGIDGDDYPMIFQTNLSKTKQTDNSTWYYIANDNKIKSLSSNGYIKGFRGYFFRKGWGDWYSKPINFNMSIDDKPTEIQDVVLINNPSNMKIFNLKGQYMGISVESLPKGIYFVNKKKVVKR